MFARRFKHAFARFCIALLCLQTVVAAYACPAFLEAMPALAGEHVAIAHAHDTSAGAGHCDEHQAPGDADRSLCHEHYAGDQSVGNGTLASALGAPVLPLAIMPVIEPTAAASQIVLPALLARATAPPLSIRFLVLRI